jgi:hypothetical protein
MVEAARRHRNAVALHLCQDPLAQAHRAGLVFRHHKRHAFVHAGVDQFGDPMVFQRLDLSE